MSGIRVTNLVKQWDETRAVDDVSFETEKGSLTVLLGPSGCGKSTILRMIAGLEEASAGTIQIGGQDVTREDPSKRGVSMVFQSYALFPHLSVRENILFGLKVRKVPKDVQERRLGRSCPHGWTGRIARPQTSQSVWRSAPTGGAHQDHRFRTARLSHG